MSTAWVIKTYRWKSVLQWTLWNVNWMQIIFSCSSCLFLFHQNHTNYQKLLIAMNCSVSQPAWLTLVLLSCKKCWCCVCLSRSSTCTHPYKCCSCFRVKKQIYRSIYLSKCGLGLRKFAHSDISLWLAGPRRFYQVSCNLMCQSLLLSHFNYYVI